MPMSQAQLAADTLAYQGYISSGWNIVAVEKVITTGAEDRAELNCAICSKPLGEYEAIKRLTFVGVPTLGLSHVQALCCYNGVACRRRKAQHDLDLQRIRTAVTPSEAYGEAAA